ncbi:MAG: L,D-transpeptidase family protein [Slackia sp.]|nr:L,D-transpeptidase family protein [Slackia sp.]
MGDLDFSMKSADEAADLLAKAESDYVLQIEGQGIDFAISSQQAGVGVDARSIVDAALDDSDPWAWPVRIMGAHDETARLVAAGDSASISAVVHEAVDAFNAEAQPSADAYVAFDEALGAYAVQKETYGAQISADAVAELVSNAVASMQDTLVLGDDVLIKPSVLSDDSRLSAAADKANLMVGCDVVLKSSTDGTEIAELDGSVISQWIGFDENLEPVLDSSVLDAWAQELAASLNTVGTTRTYTRPDGKQVEIGGGDYGWQVDSAALIAGVQDAVYNGTVGELSVPCSATGNGYTAPGQDWGAYCDVDLTEQHAYYYDASGSLLWDAPIVSGKPNGEDDTPTGVYYLKNLQQDISLKGPIDPETNKPEWDSPVDYWMPFVGNMVGLHDAPWQPASVFGNAEAYKAYGSHGCINLSPDAAAALFGTIQIGDPVIVHW